MHENSAAITELFTGNTLIVIRSLGIDLAISRVEWIGLHASMGNRHS
jgi:hypothetical protein